MRGSTPPAGPRVLIVDADPALSGLLAEWLAACGCSVSSETKSSVPEGGVLQGGFDLVIVDVPFPREGGRVALERAAAQHPGAPVLALSSSFFAGVESCGALARQLGVAGVLPKPVSCDALLEAVARALKA